MNRAGPADTDLVSASCRGVMARVPGGSSVARRVLSHPHGVRRRVCAGNRHDLAETTAGRAKGFHSRLSAQLLLPTAQSLPTTVLETQVTWEKGCRDSRDTRRHVGAWHPPLRSRPGQRES